MEENKEFEHYKLEVEPGVEAVRIDKYLLNHISREKVSRSKLQNYCDTGELRVNGETIRSNYRVRPGDIITMIREFPAFSKELIPEDIPLDIVYEDDYLLVINKKPGMVVHPGLGNHTGTMVNALLHHSKELSGGGEYDRPGIVHRIDKLTSGLLVVAKTDAAHVFLSDQFKDKSAERTYHALVWGNLEQEQGEIIGHIDRSIKDRKLRDVFPDGTRGKHAVTHYKVLERFLYTTLVECNLETGRTHQIRVHFKYLGHPLFGDPEYGGDEILKGERFTKYKQFVDNCLSIAPRQLLHAKTLGFIHPNTKQWMQFDSPIPDDMEAVLEKWRGYTKFSKK